MKPDDDHYWSKLVIPHKQEMVYSVRKNYRRKELI
jgi:hypothetical protein